MGDELFDQEEEGLKMLLSKKFDLFRKLINRMVEHELEIARISMEQARRLAIYLHETYFRHLRLYDFVFKNAKMSEVKRITLTVAEPLCGPGLEQAMSMAFEDAELSIN